MIYSVSIFTVKEGATGEVREALQEYISLCKNHQMKEVKAGRGHENPLQYMVQGMFEDTAAKEDWDQAMQQCEIDGDCFSSLMELLAKPPKIYTFDPLED